MNIKEIENSIPAIVGEMSINDRPALIALLQKNGSMVGDSTSQRDLLDATFKAIKDNRRFRSDMTAYIASKVETSQAASTTNEEATFADDNYYSNLADGRNGGSATALVNRSNWKALINKGTFVDDSRYSNAGGSFWQSIGSYFKSDAGKDTTSKVIGIGLDYFGTKLQNQAASKGNQQAIDFQNAQAQVYANQAAAAQAAALAAAAQERAAKSGGSKNKWILPVAIFAGVAIVGVVLFIAVKRRNK